MQCKELEAVLEQDGLEALSGPAQSHLADCVSCQDYLADLSLIVATAKQIPAEVAPPSRVWNSIHAQLVAEGIVVDIQPSRPLHPSWWQSFTERFQVRSFATVGVGVALLFAAYMQIQKPATPTFPSKKNEISERLSSQSAGASSYNAPSPAATDTLKVSTSGDALKPAPSEQAVSAQIVLDQGERDLPSGRLAGNLRVDAALRKNLRTVDEFIADCEKHLKANPDDELAREYLNSAYQQKAELLNAMMDSGRSEH